MSDFNCVIVVLICAETDSFLVCLRFSGHNRAYVGHLTHIRLFLE